MTRRRDTIRFILVVAGLLFIWEVIRLVFKVSPLVMPGLAAILVALWSAVTTGDILRQLAFSFSLIGMGSGVALALAFVATILAAGSRTVGGVLKTLSSIFHPLPGIALLPIVILWFGTGKMAIVVIIVHSIFWPLLTNLQAGYQSISPTFRLVGRNLGLRPAAVALRIGAPATLPYIIAGLRIAWARSWRALISAEMIFGAVAAKGGIGWYLHSRRVFMDTSGLFAGILVVMLIGSVVEQVVFGYVESKTVVRWGMNE